MTRTFDDRLAALRTGIENHEDAREVVATALGVAGYSYATDAAMIRDLFGELNAGRARFQICHAGTVRGRNDLGRAVVEAYLAIEDAGGLFTTDLNGKAGPALWLRALVSVLVARRLAELDHQFEESNRAEADLVEVHAHLYDGKTLTEVLPRAEVEGWLRGVDDDEVAHLAMRNF